MRGLGGSVWIGRGGGRSAVAIPREHFRRERGVRATNRLIHSIMSAGTRLISLRMLSFKNFQGPEIIVDSLSEDKFRLRREIGRWWFSNRVVKDWNRLSSHVVEANTIESFKRRLDCFMDQDDRWT